MREDHVHAETGHQADDALRDGKGLAVGGRIGPAHGDALSLELVRAAEAVDDVQHVRHALRRMVDVALEIDQRGALFEHAVAPAFLNRRGHRAHVGVALADVHVVADADDVGHEGNHVRGFAHGFAVGDLGFALVEVLHRKAEEVAGAGEAEAGARGIVAEERDAEPGIEHAAGDVVFAQAAQDFRHEEGRGDFVIAFFPREEEVVLIQAGGVKSRRMSSRMRIVSMMRPLLVFGNRSIGEDEDRGKGRTLLKRGLPFPRPPFPSSSQDF